MNKPREFWVLVSRSFKAPREVFTSDPKLLVDQYINIGKVKDIESVHVREVLTPDPHPNPDFVFSEGTMNELLNQIQTRDQALAEVRELLDKIIKENYNVSLQGLDKPTEFAINQARGRAMFNMHTYASEALTALDNLLKGQK